MCDILSIIQLPVLCCAFFLAAALYASVGHGGASAYLAVMGFMGMAPVEMKPIALTLNIAVSLLALVMFARAQHFRARLFWPLAAASVPAAFIGGWLQSPDPIFKIIVAATLVCGAWRLAFSGNTAETLTREPQWPTLLVLGLSLGFLSGLIGIGGGIFLTPLLILFRWTPAKPAAAVSAAFILANSLAGLSGFIVKGGAIPPVTWQLLPVVMIGGWLGSSWGSKRAGVPALKRSLAVVLLVAAAKFVTI
ncbi:MAG: sulfite exporter TauE/SafE family protein [Verrucomicrobia bacterium]|nr:sulfite exporter TauE/SafE family protein [Verrucomicrobiota bacterium]